MDDQRVDVESLALRGTCLRRPKGGNFYQDMAEQIQAGNIVAFPYDTISYLEGMWISPVTALLKDVRRSHLILYLMWSDLNKDVTTLAPQEAMLLGGILKRVIEHILVADPRLSPVYLIKVDLVESYMHLWVCFEDSPASAFIIPKKKEEDEQLVGFHLAHPMGFRDRAPFFCLLTETVVDMSTATILGRSAAPPNPLKTEARH